MPGLIRASFSGISSRNYALKRDYANGALINYNQPSSIGITDPIGRKRGLRKFAHIPAPEAYATRVSQLFQLHLGG